MAKGRNQNLFEDLALYVAMGGKVTTWVRDHPERKLRTARDWTSKPEFKALVRSHRKSVEDRVIGMHAALVVKATSKLAALLKGTDNEPLAASIARDLRDTYITMLNRDDIDRRLAALEEGQNAGSDPGRVDAAEESRDGSQGDEAGPVD